MTRNDAFAYLTNQEIISEPEFTCFDFVINKIYGSDV